MPTKKIDANHQEGELSHPGMSLRALADEEDVRLIFRITNEAEYQWPGIAAIIPCFNPGGADDQACVPPTPPLLDLKRDRTWFAAAGTPHPLDNRDIHFNHRLRAEIDRVGENGEFVFSDKWPTSTRDASAGMMMRESSDGEWVTGIGWEDFVSVQGHNPWRCMHLAVRVGPLAPGQSKTVRGRIYLFRGTKEDCFDRFQKQSL